MNKIVAHVDGSVEVVAMTADEIAQLEADRAEIAVLARASRAVILTADFLDRFEAIGKLEAILASTNNNVRKLVAKAQVRSHINLLSDQTIDGVRLILQVVTDPGTGQPYLTPEQGDQILWVPGDPV